MKKSLGRREKRGRRKETKEGNYLLQILRVQIYFEKAVHVYNFMAIIIFHDFEFPCTSGMEVVVAKKYFKIQ